MAHGDFVPSKTPIKDLTKLGFTEATREVTLYVEGVRTAEGKLVPITLDVTSNSGHFDRDLVHVVVVSNALVIGIDGTSQKEWLEGPNARRPGNPDRWNSHVRNLVEDVSPFAMTDYDFGTVDWDWGTDSPAIAARMITRAEQAIADAGGGTKIAVVGWSRGAMIAIHVASTLSNNAGRGLPRDVVFAGLYDPVNETANAPDESSPIPPSWGVVSPGVDTVVIVGANDPRREVAADVVNVDYRLTYRNDWLNDWEFRREASIDKENRGEYTVPRIRHEGGETLVTRLFSNASHGGIGGTPGYNKRHRERPDGKYNYALDVSNSLDADRAIRAGMRDEGLDFVPDRPDAWYGFAPTRPPYLE